MTLCHRVLDFWFGDPGSPEAAGPRDFWFQPSDDLDAAIRAQFHDDYAGAAAGDCDAMAEDPDSCLALIILLDQFPRNMFRGSPRAFATDNKALTLSRAAIDGGQDRTLAAHQRLFVYLPFEHSEAIADQNRAVALFEALGNPEWIDFARRHREVIERFGRFPHRNAVLGRASTPEEEAFLQLPGSSFGDQPPQADEDSASR